jgi:hypothetical protein
VAVNSWELPVNSTIAKAVAADSGQGREWRGTVIAYGNAQQDTSQRGGRDIDMDDFHAVVHYLQSTEPSTFTVEDSSDIRVKGARINCICDQETCNRPQFETIEVATTGPIFADHDTSSIAAGIGLLIFTRKLEPDRKWND